MVDVGDNAEIPNMIQPVIGHGRFLLIRLLLRQLYITVICLSKAPAAVLSSVADATASPPSSALHLTLYPAHLIGNI